MTPQEALLIAQAAYNGKEFTINGNVLSFPGTDDVQDWIRDLEAIEIVEHKEYPGLVHNGFAGRLDAIWDKIPLPPVGPITIIGHSLGGALATLASVRLQSMGYTPTVYSFGSPRVGNTTFAKAYKILHYRWVNKADLVPHVPPSMGIETFKYQHVGELQYIGLDGKLADVDKAIYLFELIRYTAITIEDHLINAYLSSIKGLPPDTKCVALFEPEKFVPHESFYHYKMVLSLEPPRSDHWPTVRKHFVEANPTCAACGSDKHLQVHHVIPFHIDGKMELDPSNFITLCMNDTPLQRCHFEVGHHGNWKNVVPTVREDAAKKLKSIK